MQVKEILMLSPQDRRAKYAVANLDTVRIDNYTFSNCKAFSFLYEKTYLKEPERSSNGSIENLDSYGTFVTPHLKIDFSLFSIDDYRALMKMLYSKNEFIVECYDIVYNKREQHKMYFATEEMPKLWTIARAINGEEWTELLGVEDYTVELIGTNVGLDTVVIRYRDENGNLIDGAAVSVTKNTEEIIDREYIPSANGKSFHGVWKDSDGFRYVNGTAIILNQDIDLYPDLQDTNEYTLSIDYGEGNKLVSQTAGTVTSVPIKNGQTINNAFETAGLTLTNGYNLSFPESGTGVANITYNGKAYNGAEVYTFAGWYWTTAVPTAQAENVEAQISGSNVFAYGMNRTMHQLYVARKHILTYNTGDTGIVIEPVSLGYGEKVVLPSLAKSGKTFYGWFLDKDFKESISNGDKMPPEDIVVYAKWG